jgi:hypothetical protein
MAASMTSQDVPDIIFRVEVDYAKGMEPKTEDVIVGDRVTTAVALGLISPEQAISTASRTGIKIASRMDLTGVSARALVTDIVAGSSSTFEITYDSAIMPASVSTVVKAAAGRFLQASCFFDVRETPCANWEWFADSPVFATLVQRNGQTSSQAPQCQYPSLSLGIPW